jgi:serine/threonine protein kinase
MPSLFRLGQVLKGRIDSYTITKELRETVWFAKYICTASQFTFHLLTSTRSQAQQLVVIKGVRDHPRVENERDVLKSLQHRTPPLIDEIEAPSTPSTIVLKHLDSDLLETLFARSFNRKELKYVSRRVLEALQILHQANYVHTGKLERLLGTL